jgi:hypothetical protein
VLTVVLDGRVIQPTTAASMAGTYTADAVGAWTTSAGGSTEPFAGDVAWLVQWSAPLTEDVAIDLTTGLTRGWAGDYTSDRVERIFDLADVPLGDLYGFQWLGVTSQLGGGQYTGTSPLDAFTEIADTEAGQYTVSRTGLPTLYGRLWRWLQSIPRVTFGEDVDAGEVPYSGDPGFVQDPAHLYNDVQVTCDGAMDATDTTTVQEAQDADSQAAYFPQTLTRTVNPSSVSQGADLAAYYVARYKDPHTRVSGVHVDLGGGLRFPLVADLSFADLVRVTKRPAVAPAKSITGFIEQVTWSGDDTGALALDLQISPRARDQFWVISPTWAQLAAPAAAGDTVVTCGPIAGDPRIPAQCTITAGQGVAVGYAVAGRAEAATIEAVQAVAAGYSTVQITLTAPLVHAHDAGEYFCDLRPDNFSQPPGPAVYPSCLDGSAAMLPDTMIGF